MAIEVPESGLNINQAADVISGILHPPDPPRVEASPLEDQPADPPRVEAPPAKLETPPDEIPAPEDTIPDEATPDADQPVESPEKEPESVSDQDPDNIEIDSAVLAEFLGVKDQDLSIGDKGVTIKTKVDGKVSDVPIKDLQASYQKSAAAQTRFESLANDKKTFEIEKKQATESIQQQQMFMAQAIQVMEDQYANEWRQTNWQQLRDDDPESYTLKRGDFDDRKKQVADFKNSLFQAYKQQEDQRQQDKQARWSEGYKYLEEEFSGESYKAAAKWDDSERNRLASWMSNAGFDNDEMVKVTSPLVFKWARDSMLRDSERKSAKEVAKKVAKLPKLKVTRPGSKKAKEQPRRTKIEELKSKQVKAAKLGGRSNLNETVKLIEGMFKR